MPAYVTIMKPTPGEKMAGTFYVCGGSSGVNDITVQIFAFNSTNDDMEQIDKATTAPDGTGKWSVQFTESTNPPPAASYVATAVGYTTTAAVVATPVQFYCDTGGDSTNCP